MTCPPSGVKSNAWTDTGRVFTHEDGSTWHPGSVTARFRRLSRHAGLPPIRLHDLRHGAATLALAGGVPLKVVSEMLGHSSIAITADTYTSVVPQVARDAAETTARLIPRRPRDSAGPISAPSGASQAADPGQEEEKDHVTHGGPRRARTDDPRIKRPPPGLSRGGR